MSFSFTNLNLTIATPTSFECDISETILSRIPYIPVKKNVVLVADLSLHVQQLRYQ